MPDDVRRIPAVRLGVDLLQLGVGPIELVLPGWLERNLLALDDPHAGLGLAGGELVLDGAPHAQPLGDELGVVLAHEHLGLEVVDGGQHRAQRRARVVAVAAHPTGDLAVGLRPLQQGVAADQLDLVEQDAPSRR